MTNQKVNEHDTKIAYNIFKNEIDINQIHNMYFVLKIRAFSEL